MKYDQQSTTLCVNESDANRTRGRQSEWDRIGAERICEETEKVCKLGATDEDIADWFDVSVRTVNNWKTEHPEFLQSLKRGKVVADAEVADALFRKAIGYERKVERIIKAPGGHQEKVTISEWTGPDTTACIFWLKNRAKDRWRDKQNLEVSGEDGGPIKHEAFDFVELMTADELQVFKQILVAAESRKQETGGNEPE